jgi:hypothetical protein
LLVSRRLRPFYFTGFPHDLFCFGVRIIISHLTIRDSKLDSGGALRHPGALITRFEVTLVYLDPIILHKDRDGRHIRLLRFFLRCCSLTKEASILKSPPIKAELFHYCLLAVCAPNVLGERRGPPRLSPPNVRRKTPRVEHLEACVHLSPSFLSRHRLCRLGLSYPRGQVFHGQTFRMDQCRDFSMNSTT